MKPKFSGILAISIVCLLVGGCFGGASTPTSTTGVESTTITTETEPVSETTESTPANTAATEKQAGIPDGKSEQDQAETLTTETISNLAYYTSLLTAYEAKYDTWSAFDIAPSNADVIRPLVGATGVVFARLLDWNGDDIEELVLVRIEDMAGYAVEEHVDLTEMYVQVYTILPNGGLTHIFDSVLSEELMQDGFASYGVDFVTKDDHVYLLTRHNAWKSTFHAFDGTVMTEAMSFEQTFDEHGSPLFLMQQKPVAEKVYLEHYAQWHADIERTTLYGMDAEQAADAQSQLNQTLEQLYALETTDSVSTSAVFRGQEFFILEDTIDTDSVQEVVLRDFVFARATQAYDVLEASLYHTTNYTQLADSLENKYHPVGYIIEDVQVLEQETFGINTLFLPNDEYEGQPLDPLYNQAFIQLTVTEHIDTSIIQWSGQASGGTYSEWYLIGASTPSDPMQIYGMWNDQIFGTPDGGETPFQVAYLGDHSDVTRTELPHYLTEEELAVVESFVKVGQDDAAHFFLLKNTWGMPFRVYRNTLDDATNEIIEQELLLETTSGAPLLLGFPEEDLGGTIVVEHTATHGLACRYPLHVEDGEALMTAYSTPLVPLTTGNAQYTSSFASGNPDYGVYRTMIEAYAQAYTFDGIYTLDDQTYVAGFQYAELVDFNNDGMDELVLVRIEEDDLLNPSATTSLSSRENATVHVFALTEEGVKHVFETTMIQYGDVDGPYGIEYSTFQDQTYLITGRMPFFVSGFEAIHWGFHGQIFYSARTFENPYDNELDALSTTYYIDGTQVSTEEYDETLDLWNAHRWGYVFTATTAEQAAAIQAVTEQTLASLSDVPPNTAHHGTSAVFVEERFAIYEDESGNAQEQLAIDYINALIQEDEAALQALSAPSAEFSWRDNTPMLRDGFLGYIVEDIATLEEGTFGDDTVFLPILMEEEGAQSKDDLGLSEETIVRLSVNAVWDFSIATPQFGYGPFTIWLRLGKNAQTETWQVYGQYNNAFYGDNTTEPNAVYVRFMGYASELIGTDTLENSMQNYLTEEQRANLFEVAGGGDEYYLLANAWDGVLRVYENSVDVHGNPVRGALLYESEAGQPLLVSCNLSSAFANVEIEAEIDRGGLRFSYYPMLDPVHMNAQFGAFGGYFPWLV